MGIIDANNVTLTLSGSKTITEADLIVKLDTGAQGFDGATAITVGTTPDPGEYKLTGSGSSYNIELGTPLTAGQKIWVKNATTTNLGNATEKSDIYNVAAAAVSNILATDAANYGDGRDLSVGFTGPSDVTKVESYKIIVVPGRVNH